MPYTRALDDRFSATVRSHPLPRNRGWEASGDVFDTETCEDIGISVRAEGRTMIDAEDRAFRLARRRLAEWRRSRGK